MKGPTLNELAFSIFNTIRPKITASESVSLDLIKYHIKNTRAQLIKNDLNKGYTVDSYIIQDLGCVEMELVDKAECCSTKVDCKFLRTKEPIPSLIELHHRQMLTRVGPVDKTEVPFDIILYQRVPFEGLNRFTRDSIRAFTMNNGGYVYLFVPKTNIKGNLIKKVNIQGVFEVPEDAAKFIDCDGNPCYTDDSPYPVKHWMINMIKDIVIKNYVGPETQAMIDYNNDSKAGYKPQTS